MISDLRVHPELSKFSTSCASESPLSLNSCERSELSVQWHGFSLYICSGRTSCRKGVDGTSMRCGTIGEIGVSWPMTGFEKKSLRAAALAQQRTGLRLALVKKKFTY